MIVPVKGPQARWVIGVVGAILVVSFVWSQFNVRAEVAQALLSVGVVAMGATAL